MVTLSPSSALKTISHNGPGEGRTRVTAELPRFPVSGGCRRMQTTGPDGVWGGYTATVSIASSRSFAAWAATLARRFSISSAAAIFAPDSV